MDGDVWTPITLKRGLESNEDTKCHESREREVSWGYKFEARYDGDKKYSTGLMRLRRCTTVLLTISGLDPKTTKGSARMMISHRSHTDDNDIWPCPPNRIELKYVGGGEARVYGKIGMIKVGIETTSTDEVQKDCILRYG